MNTDSHDKNSADHELDNLFLDDDIKLAKQKYFAWSNAWEAAEHRYEKAMTASFDDDDNSQQIYAEAMKLYHEAAKLGCLMAYEKIADMYEKGEGTPKDEQISFDYYKEGAKRGNYYCYAGMANIFIGRHNTENFHKCFNILFKSRREQMNFELEEQNSREFWLYCFLYIKACLENGMCPSKETIEDMSQHKYKISDHILKCISFDKETAKMLAESNARLAIQFPDFQPLTKSTESDFHSKILKDIQDWVNKNL